MEKSHQNPLFIDIKLMKRILIFLTVFVVVSALSFTISTLAIHDDVLFKDVVAFVPILPLVNIVTAFFVLAIASGELAPIIFTTGHLLFWLSVFVYFKLKKNWAYALLVISAILLTFDMYEFILGMMSV